jgi:hypothetical protein
MTSWEVELTGFHYRWSDRMVRAQCTTPVFWIGHLRSGREVVILTVWKKTGREGSMGLKPGTHFWIYEV